jgi:hypothetical protein
LALDPHIQSLMRHQLLQPRVLLLEFLKLLGHLRIHPAVLRSPAVLRLLADTQPSADIGHACTLPKVNVSLPKHTHDLLCTATLLHQRTLSSPTKGLEDSLKRPGAGFEEEDSPLVGDQSS